MIVFYLKQRLISHLEEYIPALEKDQQQMLAEVSS